LGLAEAVVFHEFFFGRSAGKTAVGEAEVLQVVAGALSLFEEKVRSGTLF